MRPEVVLEKLRRGEALTAKDKLTHEHGLVSVLKSLHEQIKTVAELLSDCG